MDLQRIKQFIKNTGDKFVFVEDGEASLVVMGFRDYERLLRNHGASSRAGMKDVDLIAASEDAGDPAVSGIAYHPSARPPLAERRTIVPSYIEASFETERMRQQQEEVHAWGLADVSRTEQRMENIRLEDLPL